MHLRWVLTFRVISTHVPALFPALFPGFGGTSTPLQVALVQPVQSSCLICNCLFISTDANRCSLLTRRSDFEACTQDLMPGHVQHTVALMNAINARGMAAISPSPSISFLSHQFDVLGIFQCVVIVSIIVFTVNTGPSRLGHSILPVVVYKAN